MSAIGRLPVFERRGKRRRLRRARKKEGKKVYSIAFADLLVTSF